MATPLKRIIFLLCAIALLRASPAISVPLASAIDHPAAVSSGTQPSGQYGPFRQVGGGYKGTEPQRAGIVESEQLAYGPTSDKSEVSGPHSDYAMSGSAASSGNGGSKSGWFKPAAAIGAGGAALYAVLGSSKHGNGGIGDGGGLSTSPSANLGGTPGGTSSDVPEPGTIMMLGIGIASFLGRRKLGLS